MIEFLECLSILINIGSVLNDLKNKLFNTERPKEISKWLYDIGSNIEDIAISLGRGEYPHQTCARMGYIASTFSSIIGDAITKKEEETLQELLNSVINIERIYGEYIQLESFDKTSYIQELFSISGSILGMADTLHYKK